jgi:hypothetical protein
VTLYTRRSTPNARRESSALDANSTFVVRCSRSTISDHDERSLVTHILGYSTLDDRRQLIRRVTIEDRRYRYSTLNALVTKVQRSNRLSSPGARCLAPDTWRSILDARRYAKHSSIDGACRSALDVRSTLAARRLAPDAVLLDAQRSTIDDRSKIDTRRLWRPSRNLNVRRSTLAAQSVLDIDAWRSTIHDMNAPRLAPNQRSSIDTRRSTLGLRRSILINSIPDARRLTFDGRFDLGARRLTHDARSLCV